MSFATQQENSKDWWEGRYQSAPSALYSKEPSNFLISHLHLFPEKARIVELGCGEGRNAVALAMKGFQVLGLDFSPTAITRAQQLALDSSVSIEFKTMDLDFFLPELMSFDAIVAVDFKPAPTLIKNVSRGLKQHGLLVIENPLMETAKQNKRVEAFECYKPNELLQLMAPVSSGIDVNFYSEIGPGEPGMKVHLIGKKKSFI